MASAQREFEEAYRARAAVQPPERAVLTSSLAAEESASKTGRNPLLQPADHLNHNLYPLPALKQSPYNPAFNVPRR